MTCQRNKIKYIHVPCCSPQQLAHGPCSEHALPRLMATIMASMTNMPTPTQHDTTMTITTARYPFTGDVDGDMVGCCVGGNVGTRVGATVGGCANAGYNILSRK